jgi:polysaccharide export outer membrane protein
MKHRSTNAFDVRSITIGPIGCWDWHRRIRIELRVLEPSTAASPLHPFAKGGKVMDRTFVRLVLASLVAVGTMLGAATAKAQSAVGATSPAAEPDQSSYRVGPEDVLEISVWREDALKKEVLVRPDGGLSYPLIGEVQAAGKTVNEIRAEIAKRLEKFIPEPAVSVSLLKVGSQRVYVLGKVTKPGEFAVGRYVDVLQALSMAGGLTQFAESNEIRVMRREGERQIVLPFEYARVIRGQKLEQNIQLRGGDVVVVP